MTEVAEAESLILSRMPRAPAVREPIVRCIGRVLAEDVTAERDQPPFDRVTMDGIAILYADLAAGTRRFAVAGTQAAGDRKSTRLNSSHVKISYAVFCLKKKKKANHRLLGC